MAMVAIFCLHIFKHTGMDAATVGQNWLRVKGFAYADHIPFTSFLLDQTLRLSLSPDDQLAF